MRTVDLATETTIGGRRRRATFEKLYAAHAPDARRVAFLLVGDRTLAEDLSQEAFVRVLGRFADLRNADAFRTYLMRTVVRLAKNHYRRRASEKKASVDGRHPVTTRHDPDDDLFDALKRIPERQRAALVLRFCEDLSEQHAADIMTTTPKAIRSLVTRGLQAMRKEVAR